MKRFYTQVSAAEVDGMFHILLDGKPVKTPEGQPIAAPNAALAAAMQSEWQQQGDAIDWNHLPVTRLVGGAQSLGNADAAQLRHDLAQYVNTDMLCYHAPEPAIHALQQQHWEPVLAWVRSRFDCSLLTTQAILPLTQPALAHQVVQQSLAAVPPLALVVFGRLVPALGSVWLALYLQEHLSQSEAVIEAAQLDEAYQASRWGEDDLATEARIRKADEIRLLARVLLMLEDARVVC